MPNPLRRPLGEHKVWREGDRFIKVPTKKRLFQDTSGTSINQLRANKKYIIDNFSAYIKIPDTRIEKDSQYGYRIRQRAVSGKAIDLSTLDRTSSASLRLYQIFVHNRVLWKKQQISVDFYGSEAFVFPNILHNVRLDTDGETLWLIDLGLFRGHSHNPLYRSMSHTLFHTQTALFLSTYQYINPMNEWMQKFLTDE